MFDFISAGDLVVLGVAGIMTAIVIAVTQWWQKRKGSRGDRSAEDR